MKNKHIATKTRKKNRILTKGFVILLIIIFCLMSIPAYFIATKVADNYENSELQAFQSERWDSDASLIDDRLDKNSPIAYIISPFIIQNIQSANVIVLYNDGKYISEVFTYESYDSFQEQLNSKTAFIDQLKQGYYDFKDSDWAYILTTDISPVDIREAYLAQYDIDDFSLNTQVDMSLSDRNTFFMFGVTYSNNLEPNTHFYYGRTENSETIIASERGQEVLSVITEVLTQDTDKPFVS